MGELTNSPQSIPYDIISMIHAIISKYDIFWYEGLLVVYFSQHLNC